VRSIAKHLVWATITLALLGCLKFEPDESDVMRILTELQPKEAMAAGRTIEITNNRCHLMSHHLSHECAVTYRVKDGPQATAEQTAPKTLYLILRDVDGVWTLYDQRDKP
jgi:hypothetical protein